MRRYDLGDPELDERIRRLAADAVAGHGHEHEDADLIAEMLVTTLRLHRDHPDRADLKLVNAAAQGDAVFVLGLRPVPGDPEIVCVRIGPHPGR